MKTTASEIYAALMEPWPKEAVKSYTWAKGKIFHYLDARQVQNRLDEVVGNENWQTHYSEVCGSFCCTLSVKIDDEWISKSNGAGETSVEGIKGGYSDAFKRAAVGFGIGRYLYDDVPPESAKRTGVVADVQSEDALTKPTGEDHKLAEDLMLLAEHKCDDEIVQKWTQLKNSQERTVAVWSILDRPTKRYIQMVRGAK